LSLRLRDSAWSGPWASNRYYQDADKEYYEYYGYYADDDYGYGDDYYYEVRSCRPRFCFFSGRPPQFLPVGLINLHVFLKCDVMRQCVQALSGQAMSFGFLCIFILQYEIKCKHFFCP